MGSCYQNYILRYKNIIITSVGKRQGLHRAHGTIITPVQETNKVNLTIRLIKNQQVKGEGIMAFSNSLRNMDNHSHQGKCYVLYLLTVDC